MRSLAIKLTFAFLFISILGTATVALLVNWQTRRQFDDLVNELYQDELQNRPGAAGSPLPGPGQLGRRGSQLVCR